MAFVVIGVQQALYGPAIPALRTAHDISAGAAGAALSVHFLGAVLGVLALPLIRRRGIADGVFLAASLTLIAAGCAGFLLAPPGRSRSVPPSSPGSASAASTAASTRSSPRRRRLVE